MLIAIEGNVGSGKSSILRDISLDKPNIQVTLEPIASFSDELEYSSKDPYRWSFALQSRAMTSLFQRDTKTKDTAVSLVERSCVVGQRAFMTMLEKKGYVSEIESAALMAMYHGLHLKYPCVKPDSYIFLETDPEVCMDRISRASSKNREQVGDAGITLDYLQKLKDAYDIEIQNVYETVIYVNGNAPRALVREAVKNAIDTLVRNMYS